MASILDGIQKRAEVGELDAVEWLENRGLLEGANRKIVRRIYKNIASVPRMEN